ncbi:MAG: hypothetical protein AB7U29_16325 [Desulfobulbus sp.]
MKKILFITAFCFFAFTAGSTFAAVTNSSGDSFVLGASGRTQLTIQLSSTVHMGYDGGTAGTTYSIAAYHDKGTRTFASTSNDAKIYYQEATGVTCPTAPTGTGTGTFGTGWESL